MAFSQQNFIEFCSYKKLVPGTKDMPYTDSNEFLLVYIDDINIRSHKKYGKSAHLYLIELILYCYVKANLQLAGAKSSIMKDDFVFLGHSFTSTNNKTSIPAENITHFY